MYRERSTNEQRRSSAYTLLENNRWKIERSTPRKNLPCHRMDGRFAWATDSNTKHSPRRYKESIKNRIVILYLYSVIPRCAMIELLKRKRSRSGYGSNLCEGPSHRYRGQNLSPRGGLRQLDIRLDNSVSTRDKSTTEDNSTVGVNAQAAASAVGRSKDQSIRLRESQHTGHGQRGRP